MYRQNKSPAIPPETLTHIYDQCLRPAAIHANPADQCRWPINRAAAMTQYRDQKGLLHFCSCDMPSHLLGRFSSKLNELFDKHDDLRDSFFLHEFRGTKSASIHVCNDPGGREAALKQVMRSIDESHLKPSDWVIDVALEAYHPGHVLQWSTSGHRRILQYALPSASAAQIDRLLNSKQRYQCDLSAQLRDLGGCRILPGSRISLANNVSYINVYTTDKAATYQLHEGIYKRRKAWHLFPQTSSKLIKDIERIVDVFRMCGGTQDGNGLEGNARLELRVPLELGNHVLLDLPYDFIQDTMLSYNCQTFWYAKSSPHPLFDSHTCYAGSSSTIDLPRSTMWSRDFRRTIRMPGFKIDP